LFNTHQEVLLDLQDRYLIVEDEAIQAELQEDQQREADEAAAEEAEEAREEEVRLRRQEQQQQLREAQLRQQQQQQMLSVGSGPMYHQAASYTGEGAWGVCGRM
jgi:serine phosphatase RsbU (regulator of sigma subunit)